MQFILYNLYYSSKNWQHFCHVFLFAKKGVSLIFVFYSCMEKLPFLPLLQQYFIRNWERKWDKYFTLYALFFVCTTLFSFSLPFLFFSSFFSLFFFSSFFSFFSFLFLFLFLLSHTIFWSLPHYFPWNPGSRGSQTFLMYDSIWLWNCYWRKNLLQTSHFNALMWTAHGKQIHTMRMPGNNLINDDQI